MVEHRKKLMTYEQWKVLYKKYVKKLIRQKVINFLYWVVMIAISVALVNIFWTQNYKNYSVTA